VEKVFNIRCLLKTLVLISGLLAITVSSFSDVIQDRLENNLSRIKIEGEKSQQESNHEIIYLPDYLASISSFQIHVDQIQSIFFVIPLIRENKCWYEIILESGGISFFKVLFRNIIAPNAP
jgi:hypothetical protein